MLPKGHKGKRIWFDTERNVFIAVFNNRSPKGFYGKISITELKGMYKGQIDMSIPAFERLIELISRMPKIIIQKDGKVTVAELKEEKKKNGKPKQKSKNK